MLEKNYTVANLFCDNISDEIKSQMKSEIIKTGIVFGEDNGLSNEELQKCHYHLIIPASEEYRL